MKRTVNLKIISTCLLLFLFSCDKHFGQPVLLSGNTMGTTYNIKFIPNEDSMNTELVQQNIDNLLNKINLSMSTYDPASEISLLNANKSKGCIPLSNDLFYVIEQAQQVSKLSRGSFDITIAPLVNIWGFGPTGFPIEIPADETISDIKARVGFLNLRLDKDNSCLLKQHPEITVDLSAIAKGYAVDEVSKLLKSLSINRYMVEIGGEISAEGLNINEIPWQIGIEKPISDNRSIQKIISLKNASMATSGDYRNFFEYEGKQYSHLIDANTGKPIEHKLVSVTVIHDSCIIADALATALIVMGYDKAYELAETEQLAVMFIAKHNNDFIETLSNAFPKTQAH